ncbi:hypothetical protein [Polyangium mundeleinium]|uniref:Secreted protein n=1 Tax=Polyangium mundeleinium TaxID=2995306 RepID=A0ABT5F190_9BACT|nr:hypothetical protein [Polyangium mundeleinium]MDC0747844.1 hypothetical protein [Polyangium mundeleinium]
MVLHVLRHDFNSVLLAPPEPPLMLPPLGPDPPASVELDPPAPLDAALLLLELNPPTPPLDAEVLLLPDGVALGPR